MNEGDLQVVQFHIGKEEYAIPISRVQEILRVPQTTNMPRSPQHVLGITNIRGTVISVLDLKQFLMGQDAELTENSRIVVVESEGQKTALVVDEVTEVLTLPGDSLVESSQVAIACNQDYVMGVARLDDKIVILLNIDHICHSNQTRVS